MSSGGRCNHLPPYAFYWGWEKMRSLHDFLQGDMI